MDTLHWRKQGLGERVLRVWLGATFTYAGVQKLSDHHFFHKGSPTYIGSQLHGFAQGSPIAPLLHIAEHAPVLVGVATAMTEIFVGIATLAGVAPAVAAGVGALLSITLWLSASWHVHPYFLGSDSIYAVAWIAYLLMLPSVRARLAPPAPARAPSKRRPVAQASDDERRHLLRVASLVVVGLAIGGVAAAKGRARAGTKTASPASTAAATPTASSTARASSETTGPATPSSAAGGPVITSLANLTQQGAVSFNDAAAGASILVSLGGDKAVAFSSTCTHAGCSVGYDPSSKLIICPCHGSEFDPANGAKVLNGPAPSPLPSVAVVVDTTSGEVRQA